MPPKRAPEIVRSIMHRLQLAPGAPKTREQTGLPGTARCEPVEPQVGEVGQFTSLV